MLTDLTQLRSDRRLFDSSSLALKSHFCISGQLKLLLKDSLSLSGAVPGVSEGYMECIKSLTAWDKWYQGQQAY